MLGSFLNTASASSDPFLQPTRSPSPTVHGKEVFMLCLVEQGSLQDISRCSDIKTSCRQGFVLAFVFVFSPLNLHTFF